MANSYKILAQAIPTAATLTDIYTVPAGNSAVISTINICNITASNVSFRLAARQAGAALNNKHYLVFDTPIPAQDSIALSMGITLAATDVISAYSYQGNVSFNIFGSEIN